MTWWFKVGVVVNREESKELEERPAFAAPKAEQQWRTRAFDRGIQPRGRTLSTALDADSQCSSS